MRTDKCDIMPQDKCKMTPLHLAAEQSNSGVLNLLLSKGVNCNTGNVSGRTPLHLAAAKGCDM